MRAATYFWFHFRRPPSAIRSATTAVVGRRPFGTMTDGACSTASDEDDEGNTQQTIRTKETKKKNQKHLATRAPLRGAFITTTLDTKTSGRSARLNPAVTRRTAGSCIFPPSPQWSYIILHSRRADAILHLISTHSYRCSTCGGPGRGRRIATLSTLRY